jgi:hypothetical protein
MDDALVVGFLKRLGDLQGDRQRLVDRQRLQALRDVFTFDELEREKGARRPLRARRWRRYSDSGREQMGLAADRDSRSAPATCAGRS